MNGWHLHTQWISYDRPYWAVWGNVWPTAVCRDDREVLGVWYLGVSLGRLRLDVGRMFRTPSVETVGDRGVW